MELTIGIKCVRTETVTEEKTAAALGSGGLSVYATPAMIRLMENAAWSSVESCMDEGCSTVGTVMDVKHVAASPAGASIRCETELVEIDGRRLVFKVTAWDDTGLIGEGRHERFVINSDRFMSRTLSRHENG